MPLRQVREDGVPFAGSLDRSTEYDPRYDERNRQLRRVAAGEITEAMALAKIREERRRVEEVSELQEAAGCGASRGSVARGQACDL